MRRLGLVIVLSASLTCVSSARADDNAVKAFTEGNLLMQAGKVKEAIPHFDDAIRLDPSYLAAWQNRGLCHAQMREFEKAIADATQALKLDPEFAYGYQLRAFTYHHWGKYKEAIKEGDEAIRLSPKYAAALSYRGRSYAKLRQYDKAITDFDAAIKESPRDSMFHYYRGETKFEQGKDFEGACNDLGVAVSQQRGLFHAQGMIAVCLARRGVGIKEDLDGYLEACEKYGGAKVRKQYEDLVMAAQEARAKEKK